MSLEQDLRVVLARHADDVEVPKPDIDAMVRPGGAENSSRRWWYGAAAAAAVTALIGGGLGWAALRDGQPGPADPGPTSPEVSRPVDVQSLSSGEVPDVPYCWNGEELRGVPGPSGPLYSSCLTLMPRDGTTIGWDDSGVYLLSTANSKILLDRRQRVGDWMPAMSANGRWAAWLVEDAGSLRVVAFDLWSKELRSIEAVAPTIELAAPEGAAWVPGIGGDGRVYLASDVAGRVWVRDGGGFAEVRGLPKLADPAVFWVTADGIAARKDHWWDTGSQTSHAYVGKVDTGGRFVLDQTRPVGWANFAPDGERFVQEVEGYDYWVQSSEDLSHHVELLVPEQGAAVSLPVWESLDTLLVSFDPSAEGVDGNGFDAVGDDLWLLRCSSDTGECEVALPPGNAGDLRGPLYR